MIFKTFFNFYILEVLVCKFHQDNHEIMTIDYDSDFIYRGPNNDLTEAS